MLSSASPPGALLDMPGSVVMILQGVTASVPVSTGSGPTDSILQSFDDVLHISIVDMGSYVLVTLDLVMSMLVLTVHPP